MEEYFDNMYEAIKEFDKYNKENTMDKPNNATYYSHPNLKPLYMLIKVDVDLPVYDFSTTPEQRANEQAAIDKAIKDAEAAMKAPAAKKQPAPAVKAIAKKLVPAKKAAKGSKSGRVVGISADENIFLKQLLLDIANNTQYNKDAAYTKLMSRYNKN